MKSKVDISVLMGVYNTNQEKMVRRAIESIQNQTFTNWEFIICDDGSDDGTYELLSKIIKGDNRIRLIRNKENQGLAAALNHCLEFASGTYAARMDVDDISMPERFEKQIKFLERNHEYQLVGSAVELFDSNGIWGQRSMPEKPEKKAFLWGSPFVHPSILIRRDVLVKIKGYRVAKETKRTEDYDLFMRCYAAGFKGYNMQEVLYQFCEDKNSVTRKKYRYRIDEAKIRYKGFRKLGLMPKGILYVFKPLIVGLLPYSLLVRLRGDKKERG